MTKELIHRGVNGLFSQDRSKSIMDYPLLLKNLLRAVYKYKTEIHECIKNNSKINITIFQDVTFLAGKRFLRLL